MRASHDGPKKNELAQNICASSIQYSICIVDYWTEKPPGPPRGAGCQPFVSFKLKLCTLGVASHHTAVSPFWDAAAEVVTTTQYWTPWVRLTPARPKLAVANPGAAVGTLAFTALPSCVTGISMQLSE